MNTNKANGRTEAVADRGSDREASDLSVHEHPNRQCLPCTACCDGWLSAGILEHEVKPGKPCPFSTPSGCSIYNKRPVDPCHTFICSWRVAESPLPEWMRPDQSGAIVLLSLEWEGELVISVVPVGVKTPEKTLEWLQAYARKHNRPMIYYERLKEGEKYTGLKRFGYGPAKFRQKVIDLGLSSAEIKVRMSSESPV